MANWTDNPATSSTHIRAVHLNEIRWTVDRNRQVAGMAAFGWHDTPITNVVHIRAIHFTEIRAAILQHMSLPNWSYGSDPIPGGGRPISARDINDLRAWTDQFSTALGLPTGPDPAPRGMEVLGDVDPNDAYTFGLTTVKVRYYADIDRIASTLQNNPAVRVVTRFWGPNLGQGEPDGCDFNNAYITDDAFNWYNKLSLYNALGKWSAHIPVNEPNVCTSPGVSSAQFQAAMQSLTSAIDTFKQQQGIVVPWATPPLGAGATSPSHESEGDYITALMNSGALSANYSVGSGAIWKYVGAHNYWNSCSDIMGSQGRYTCFTYWYVQQMAQAHGKQVVMDEVNSNAPCAGGQYSGGYGDDGRLTDLLRFLGQVEANFLPGLLVSVVFTHSGDTSACGGQGWRQFDYTQTQWNQIASGKVCPFDCSQPCP